LFVTAIRTVTVTMPPLFRDLIAQLMAGHRSLNVVAELGDREVAEDRLRSLAPELVFVGLERNEGDEIGLLLARRLPDAKVIAFTSDGRDAFVHRVQPQRTILRDFSPQMLIDVILEDQDNPSIGS
jgi:DNA-binding NarL/FixJ family response regulator